MPTPSRPVAMRRPARPRTRPGREPVRPGRHHPADRSRHRPTHVVGPRTEERGVPLSELNERHRQALEGSAISPEVIKARGYRSMGKPYSDTFNVLREAGIPMWARRDDTLLEGLLIPLYRATGEQISYQYRPDRTPKIKGKARKYASSAGRPSVLDVHPHNTERIKDTGIPLWITEGVKKADALTSAGLCVVALSGVYNWRSKLGSLGDWEDIPLKGREVFICFDSDAADNPNVARAMARLGAWL